jgi:hypothetical protein
LAFMQSLSMHHTMFTKQVSCTLFTSITPPFFSCNSNFFAISDILVFFHHGDEMCIPNHGSYSHLSPTFMRIQDDVIIAISSIFFIVYHLPSNFEKMPPFKHQF